MISAILAFSLRNRALVLLLSLLCLLVGPLVARELPIDVFPDLSAPRVTIVTEVSGLASEEVESLVTYPVESALFGLPGVRRLRSASAPGISLVWVEFDWDSDRADARQRVGERLRSLNEGLPTGASTPVLAPDSSVMGEIAFLALSSEKLSGMQLRRVADLQLRRKLLGVRGVSQVVSLGGDLRQYQIKVDPLSLATYGLTLSDLSEALERSGHNAPGGYLEDRGRESTIRVLARPEGVQDLRELLVARRESRAIRVGDVATVELGPAVRRGSASYNGQPAVLLSIVKQPGADTVGTTERVDELLEKIAPALLAQGVELHTEVFRQKDFIDRAIANLYEVLRDGAILVVLVIALFLWSARPVLISVLAIPLTMGLTAITMHFLGLRIDTMTLGGLAIAIGEVVDDAIVDVENVTRRLRESFEQELSEKNVLQKVLQASKEIRSSLVSATGILLLVFLPLLLLDGIEGRLLAPLAKAYMIAIAASLLVAITTTPVLCSYLLPGALRTRRSGNSPILALVQKAYRPILEFSVRRFALVLGAALLALGVALFALLPMGRSFLPEFNEGSLNIAMVLPPGSTLNESDALGRLAEKALLKDPAVLSVGRRSGRAEKDEHVQGVEASEFELRLKEGDPRGKKQIFSDIRERLRVVPGAHFEIGQPISHRVDHMLSGQRSTLSVKIFGENLDQLRSFGAQVEAIAEQTPGLVDVALEAMVDTPQLVIRVRGAPAARYGMSKGEVAEQISSALWGKQVGEIYEDSTTTPIVLLYAPELRDREEKIAALQIRTPQGATVELQELAEISSLEGPNYLLRENMRRRLVLQANLDSDDPAATLAALSEGIEGQIDLPSDMEIRIDGQLQRAQSAYIRLWGAGVLVFVGVALMIHAAVHSRRRTLIVLLNLPFALTGGVVGVYLADSVLSVATMIGFITLFGIAVRNGILLVTRVGDLEAQGVELKQAVRQAASERLGPILMTALTAALGLLPLALALGQPGSEIQAPMALVILTGLVSSTALNMTVIPGALLRWGGSAGH